jgi:hypothetical protein
MYREDRTQKVFGNAAKGALIGLGIGALTGNAGRGAGIGALTGAATGLFGGDKSLKGGARSRSRSRKTKKRRVPRKRTARSRR